MMEQITQRYKQIWFGRPWYGKGIETIVKDIPFQKVLTRLDGSHNIAEMVYHMNTWKKYVLRMMVELKHSSIPDHENFPKIDKITAEGWNDLLQTLFDTHRKMLAILSESYIDLDAQVDGSKFTIGEMVLGIMDHDLYHVGQLRLLSIYLTNSNEQI